MCNQISTSLSSEIGERALIQSTDAIVESSIDPFAETSDPIDTSVNSEIARKALVQFTDAIVESNIDHFALVRKLYSKESVSESVYKRVRDRECRDTREERLENILDEVRDRVKHDDTVFRTFLDILCDLSQKDLADKIMAKYKGIPYCILHYKSNIMSSY